jgi:cytochrome c5
MAFSRASALIATGIAASILTLACAAPPVPPVTPADAQRAQTRWPGTDVAQLESGRALFMDKCSACHVPPSPASLKAEAWPAQVEEMKLRAGLGDEQVQLVERYLITMESRGEAASR